jgi:hypothetical protein
MTYYEDDFYNEPSEFDQQVDEFKKGLMSYVKQEFLDKLARLEKENLELQNIKNNWKDIQLSYDNKKRDLDYAKNNAMSEAKSLRLAELIKDYQLILYSVNSISTINPKCNNCDEHRQLHFTTPLGKDIRGSCDCNSYKYTYVPTERMVYEFRIESYGKELLVWYKELKGSYGDTYFEIEGDGFRPKVIFNKDTKYEDLQVREAYFKTKEDCQKYCDWLNTNNKKQ